MQDEFSPELTICQDPPFESADKITDIANIIDFFSIGFPKAGQKFIRWGLL